MAGWRGVGRALQFLFLLTVWVVPLGCRSPTPPRAAPDHLGALLPRDDPRPAHLLEALLANGAARRGLRGFASLALDGPEGSARAKQIVLLERPARLRVEVLGFLNQSVAVLTTDGERFALFRVEERAIEEGEIRPSLLWEVAGIALQPDAAVRVLLGVPGLPDGARALPARVTRTGGIRVAFAHEGHVVAFEFGADKRLRAWRLESDGAGTALIEASYSAYAPLAGTQFAHQIELLDHLHGTRAVVHFSDVELNPDLPPSLFSLQRGARP